MLFTQADYLDPGLLMNPTVNVCHYHSPHESRLFADAASLACWQAELPGLRR